MQEELKSVLPENPTIEELTEFFRNDVYAYDQTDCRIIEGCAGHAVTEMRIDPAKHYNAQGYVMGGAIFTLADYALAVASVCGKASSVTLTTSIEYLSAGKGEFLRAECDKDKSGKRVGFFTTRIFDDSGKLIAKTTATCYHP